MITEEQMEAAKARTHYGDEAHHEHADCVRIAYEWLDAQVKTAGINRSTRPIKHIIESWGGRYVSQSDVEVAAELHPAIRGRYPHFNISKNFTNPIDLRLQGIGEANTMLNYKGRYRDAYKQDETY